MGWGPRMNRGLLLGIRHQDQRIRLFESRGRISPDGNEQFRTPSWLAVMWGQGLRPRAPDPLSLSLRREDVDDWLAQTRQTIRNCCDFMPRHEDFLAQI